MCIIWHKIAESACHTPFPPNWNSRNIPDGVSLIQRFHCTSFSPPQSNSLHNRDSLTPPKPHLTFDHLDLVTLHCIPNTDVGVDGPRYDELGIWRPADGHGSGSVAQEGMLVLCNTTAQHWNHRPQFASSLSTGNHCNLQQSYYQKKSVYTHRHRSLRHIITTWSSPSITIATHKVLQLHLRK